MKHNKIQDWVRIEPACSTRQVLYSPAHVSIQYDAACETGFVPFDAGQKSRREPLDHMLIRLQSCKLIFLFYKILARTTIEPSIEPTIEASYFFYKVVPCLFNFKRIGNLFATSFLENKRYCLQAREQGFPKLRACNKASN